MRVQHGGACILKIVISNMQMCVAWQPVANEERRGDGEGSELGRLKP
jgi:hypothetical protein